MLAALAGAVALALVAMLTPPTLISGRAEVVDGDTLRIADRRIRLLGLDAPELSQSCTDATGAAWDCGREARSFVVNLVSGQTVSCRSLRRDSYGRSLAKCDSGGSDLGAQIVAAGWAVPEDGYFDEANTARTAKRGIWSGTFVAPAEWRHRDSNPWSIVWSWITSWFHS